VSFAQAQEPQELPSEHDPAVLQEVTVQEPRRLGYQAPTATTATGLEMPILQTPVSVQVVPRAVLEDQQVIEPKEALKNVSGVQPAFGFGSLFTGFTIRGFTPPVLNQSLFHNGIRRRTNAFETANLEQIEVLKGPAAVLYGRLDPGGIINLVTTRPSPEPSYAAQQQVGSFDLYRTVLDATGPVTADRSLLYRTTLAYQNSESFRDFERLERAFFAPSVTWLPTPRTEINLALEYKHDDQVTHWGIPAVGRRPASISISRFLGDRTEDGRFDHNDRDTVLLELHWSHRLTSEWTVRQHFLMDRYDSFYENFPPLGLREDNRILDRGFEKGPVHIHSYGTNLELLGRVEGWGTAHTLLAGFDYYQLGLTVPGATLVIGPSFVSPIDIVNPVYGRVPIPHDLPLNFFQEFREHWYGWYLQDSIELRRGLHLLVGGRYDVARISNGVGVTADLPTSGRTDRAFSPRVGLLYEVRPWWSVYGNVVRSLGLAAGFSADGRPLKAERATQYEVGTKLALLEGRLTSTVALYRLTKDNVLSTDPTNPLARIPIGETRSRGIEWDVGGQLTEHWRLIGSYAYTDTRITDDPLGGNEGHRLPDVPLHSGSLWAWYRFGTGAFNGLEAGAGLFAAGRRQGDEQNSFLLPGYVRLDAAATYRWQVGRSRLTARLNIYNLLDQQYFESSNIIDPLVRIPRLGITPGAPLTVLGSIQVAYW